MLITSPVTSPRLPCAALPPKMRTPGGFFKTFPPSIRESQALLTPEASSKERRKGEVNIVNLFFCKASSSTSHDSEHSSQTNELTLKSVGTARLPVKTHSPIVRMAEQLD